MPCNSLSILIQVRGFLCFPKRNTSVTLVAIAEHFIDFLACTNRIKKDGGPPSSLLHCRSSGLRVSTAAGSTAAIHSAGGSTMPILCKELQYMVREPIFPGATSHLMHGFVKSSETMDISWFCREGLVYIDGSHVVHSVQLGDTIELSCRAPPLKVYLSSNLLSENSV